MRLHSGEIALKSFRSFQYFFRVSLAPCSYLKHVYTVDKAFRTLYLRFYPE